MNKTIICYFSATGTTKVVAEKLANLLNGNLFEIEPVIKYTNEDLNWMDEKRAHQRLFSHYLLKSFLIIEMGIMCLVQ